MGQSGGVGRSRDRRAASQEAVGAARHAARCGGPLAGHLHDRRFKTWHYWWQAHLLDCLVDAQVRDPRPERVESITRQIRGHWLRNNATWTNNYYDDMAWLALAIERAGRLVGVEKHSALRKLSEQFINAWVPGRRRHPVA